MDHLSYQKHNRPSSSKTGCWVALLFLCAFVGGFFWMISGVGRLSQSIVGSSSSGLSESMEPYELRFRTSAKDVTPLEAESLPRKEWILNIPRAFVVNVAGRNGAYGPDDDFIVRLEVVLNPETQAVKPLAYATQSRDRPNSINVKLINGAFPSALSKVDYCVRHDDYFEFLTKFGEKYAYGGKCDNESARCEVHANIDGWPVGLFIPRSLYFSDPQPACRAVEALLEKYTTRRDVVN